MNISSLFIHAAMHDGSYEWVLIGGTQNLWQTSPSDHLFYLFSWLY